MDNSVINIGKGEAKEFLDFLTAKRQKFVLDNSIVFDTLQDYNDKIDKLKKTIEGTLDATSNNESDYPLGASWNQRIQYFLNKHIGGITARGLTNMIASIEGIKDSGEYKKYYASISPTLSAGTGTIYDRKNNEKGDYVYSIKSKSPKEGA